MRYSKIREMDISNGEGIGVSLFVQGCHFHCKGCFNQETWDFNGGKEWTKEIEDEFIKLAGKPYINRISILGGEPLADENIETVFSVVRKLKSIYPNKKIWIYTGYLWEDICKFPNDGNFGAKTLTDYFENNKKFVCALMRQQTVFLSDIIVDGQFQIENQDIYNEKIIWAGSTNQRIINVKEQFI